MKGTNVKRSDDQLNAQSEGEQKANIFKPKCDALPSNSPVKLVLLYSHFTDRKQAQRSCDSSKLTQLANDKSKD